MTMRQEERDTFYLFTLVNISEDSGLNGEYENKLFRSYKKARQFMEECIDKEMSIQKSENHCQGILERIDDDLVNLWLNRECSEGVMYGISKIRPI